MVAIPWKFESSRPHNKYVKRAKQEVSALLFLLMIQKTCHLRRNQIDLKQAKPAIYREFYNHRKQLNYSYSTHINVYQFKIGGAKAGQK